MAVQVTVDEGVMTLTLDRAGQLNAFNRELQRDFAAALRSAARDSDVRALVLTGAGRGFCVGQDLEESIADRDAYDRLGNHYIPNILALRTLEKPVIGAVNGAAAGAGLALAVACDIRIASSKAKFVPAWINIGLVPDSGGSYFVPRLIGYARALEWFASGRHMAADEALALGLVSEVVAPDALLARATELAQAFAAMPPCAVAMTKRVLQASERATLPEQLQRERELQAVAIASQEYGDAVGAFLARSG
ncbi:MAG: enoyl-CoA hydratase-related protein [Solirubrobacteraceae bacterium]|jgi:2-(1,2-epoxy-1,2-dihydrophenyl)acetyl-CoA isomerase